MRPLELAFPYAIDKLQADEGHRDGEKPVVVDDVPLEVQLLNPRQSQTHTLGPHLSSFICCLATGFGPTCLQLGWQWLGKWCDCKYVETGKLKLQKPSKKSEIEDTVLWYWWETCQVVVCRAFSNAVNIAEIEARSKQWYKRFRNMETEQSMPMLSLAVLHMSVIQSLLQRPVLSL